MNRTTYRCWVNMRHRCFNADDKDYARYGGRGITVCARWLTYENFLADMGKRPEGLTLGRLDNDKGYEKDNCAWVSRQDQATNKGKYKNNTSGLIGVSLHKSSGDWRAYGRSFASTRFVGASFLTHQLLVSKTHQSHFPSRTKG